MRVKLSYTVKATDVLKETAKIINLSAEDLQQCVSLFTALQQELKGENDEHQVVNINKSLEMIEEFRDALMAVDLRLHEIKEIVRGYDEYQKLPSDARQPGDAEEDLGVRADE